MTQRILRGVGIAAMMAFLAGCDEVKFNGLMGVNEQISFAQDGRAFDGETEPDRAPSTVVVAPGQFQAKAIIGTSGSKKQIKLEIANGDNPTVVKLKFDKNINIGENFTLTAAQIGQNFDLTGNIATRVEKSPEYSGTEHCTYQYPQTVCRSAAKSAGEAAASETLNSDLSEFALASGEVKSPSVPNPTLVRGHHPVPGNGHVAPPPHTPVCHTVWVNRPGTMYVRYYHETTLRDINTSFVQGDKTLASYKGNSSVSRTVYTYQSQCH